MLKESLPREKFFTKKNISISETQEYWNWRLRWFHVVIELGDSDHVNTRVSNTQLNYYRIID